MYSWTIDAISTPLNSNGMRYLNPAPKTHKRKRSQKQQKIQPGIYTKKFQPIVKKLMRKLGRGSGKGWKDRVYLQTRKITDQPCQYSFSCWRRPKSLCPIQTQPWTNQGRWSPARGEDRTCRTAYTSNKKSQYQIVPKCACHDIQPFTKKGADPPKHTLQ